MTTVRRDSQAGPQGFDRLNRWRDSVAARLNHWFARLDAVLAGERVWIGAVAFVLVLQIVLTTQHRPWLDEWQALQLAVQSPHLSDLMFSLRYEGHPPLWHLLLRATATMFSDPVRALPALALIIAIPVQLTILLAALYSRAERVMISLSEFVLFDFLTISRSQTLGIALMIAIAALWQRRRLVWLLIAILPLCDFLFGVVSLLFLALRWRERRVYWPFAVLWAVSGLYAAWSIRPMPDMVAALLPKGPVRDFPLWLANMATLGLPLQWDMLHPRWNAPPPPGLGGPALMGFFWVAWIELRKKRDYAIAFGAFVVVLLVFSLTIYQLSIRHLMLAAMLLIVLVWRMADEGSTRSVWWRTWLLITALCGLFTAAVNLVEPFDTSPEAVAVINRMGLRDKVWVPFPHSAGQAIAALNGMMFERISQHCSEDFVRWNTTDDHNIGSFKTLDMLLSRKVDQDGQFYLITKYVVPDRPPLIRRIAAVRPGYDMESYNMYIVGEGRPEARPHHRPCNGWYGPLRPN